MTRERPDPVFGPIRDNGYGLAVPPDGPVALAESFVSVIERPWALESEGSRSCGMSD